MITVNFVSFRGTLPQLYSEEATFIDIIATLDCKKFNQLLINGKIVGIDISPYAKLRDYTTKKTLLVEWTNRLTFSNPISQVVHMKYLYITRKLAFPPALNFLDVDPLNYGPIGTWIGWGNEPVILSNSEDNSPRNIILVTLTTGVTYAYNKYCYYEWISKNVPIP